MYRIAFYFLLSFVLTMSVHAGEGKGDVATGGELKLSAACKGFNVAYARFGNCGYGHFQGYSFGSGKTFGQLLVPLTCHSMAGDECRKYMTCSIKTDYCGFSQMELVYDERGKLWRIVLTAIGNEGQMLKMSQSVRKDLVLAYGFRQQDWTSVHRGDAKGVCVRLPGGLEMMVLECRNSLNQIRLEVVVQNRRVIEPVKKDTVGSGDLKIDVDV